MRYCEFNCGDDANTDAAMSEMINMRLKLGGDEGTLQDDFDKLIAEMRTKASLDSECEIHWANESIAVKNDSVKQLMRAVEQFDTQLQQTVSHDDKLDCRTQAEKKAKPQDLLRLYDSVIEDCNEIQQLPGASANEQIKSAFHATTEYCRAFRCYYMAEAYANLSKWRDAVALYDRAMQRCSSAISSVHSNKHSAYLKESAEDELKELLKQITSAKYTTQANRLAEAAGETKEEGNGGAADTRPLIETLDEYRKISPEDLLKPEPNVCIVPMPPQFIPMPNKPMFFDLALNHIKMPDLETKIASYVLNEKKSPSKQKADGGKKSKGAQQVAPEQDQGIGGMVKGWFWGKK
ncbi:unnamed protein product [Toxocara canis]|uniref:Signal recognition particle subunit SRP68 n=1 Tax=Toxocara canis TaxID=6265 RepID=A0A183V450_TOXCA|nr:unnamed protein product [Toxocara canis]